MGNAGVKARCGVLIKAGKKWGRGQPQRPYTELVNKRAKIKEVISLLHHIAMTDDGLDMLKHDLWCGVNWC